MLPDYIDIGKVLLARKSSSRDFLPGVSTVFPSLNFLTEISDQGLDVTPLSDAIKYAIAFIYTFRTYKGDNVIYLASSGDQSKAKGGLPVTTKYLDLQLALIASAFFNHVYHNTSVYDAIGNLSKKNPVDITETFSEVNFQSLSTALKNFNDALNTCWVKVDSTLFDLASKLVDECVKFGSINKNHDDNFSEIEQLANMLGCNCSYIRKCITSSSDDDAPSQETARSVNLPEILGRTQAYSTITKLLIVKFGEKFKKAELEGTFPKVSELVDFDSHGFFTFKSNFVQIFFDNYCATLFQNLTSISVQLKQAIKALTKMPLYCVNKLIIAAHDKKTLELNDRILMTLFYDDSVSRTYNTRPEDAIVELESIKNYCTTGIDDILDVIYDNFEVVNHRKLTSLTSYVGLESGRTKIVKVVSLSAIKDSPTLFEFADSRKNKKVLLFKQYSNPLYPVIIDEFEKTRFSDVESNQFGFNVSFTVPSTIVGGGSRFTTDSYGTLYDIDVNGLKEELKTHCSFVECSYNGVSHETTIFSKIAASTILPPSLGTDYPSLGYKGRRETNGLHFRANIIDIDTASVGDLLYTFRTNEVAQLDSHKLSELYMARTKLICGGGQRLLQDEKRYTDGYALVGPNQATLSYLTYYGRNLASSMTTKKYSTIVFPNKVTYEDLLQHAISKRSSMFNRLFTFNFVLPELVLPEVMRLIRAGQTSVFGALNGAGEHCVEFSNKDEGVSVTFNLDCKENLTTEGKLIKKIADNGVKYCVEYQFQDPIMNSEIRFNNFAFVNSLGVVDAKKVMYNPIAFNPEKSVLDNILSYIRVLAISANIKKNSNSRDLFVETEFDEDSVKKEFSDASEFLKSTYNLTDSNLAIYTDGFINLKTFVEKLDECVKELSYENTTSLLRVIDLTDYSQVKSILTNVVIPFNSSDYGWVKTLISKSISITPRPKAFSSIELFGAEAYFDQSVITVLKHEMLAKINKEVE